MNLDDTGHAGRWSPDGGSILFVATPEPNHHKAVFRLSIADGVGGAVEQLPLAPGCGGPAGDGESYGCYSPSWSRDGTRIAFASDRSGNYDIWEVELATGAVRQITKNPANDFGPAWSPVNTTIAFVSDRQDRPGVWTIDANTGAESSYAVAQGAVSAPSSRKTS